MEPTLIDLLRLHRDLNRKLSIMLNGAILIIHSKPIDPIHQFIFLDTRSFGRWWEMLQAPETTLLQKESGLIL